MSSPAIAEAEPTITPALRILILLAVIFASTLYGTTFLLVSVLLPQIQGTMAATQDEIAWVMTFNILATAVATPMTGWLVARFGRRNVMLGSCVTFTTATFLCGTAESLIPLVIYRVIQGAGGAPVVPLSQTILLDIFPRRQHASITSIFGMAVVLGPVMGPTLGGYLAEAYGWRWSFFMLVPVGAATVVGLLLTMPRDRPNAKARLDWTGFLAIATAVVALQSLLSRGQRLDWFESPEIVIEAVVAVLAFYIFVVHSLTTTATPFIDLRFLKDRNYAIGLVLVTIYGMLNFTPMVLLPPLLQTHAGYTDSVVGQVIGARGLGACTGFFLAMFIGKLDPRIGMSLGFGCLAWAGWDLTYISLDVPPSLLAWNSAVQGMAIGLIWVPLLTAAFATLPSAHMAQASAIFHLLRNIGSSVFISLTVAYVVRSTGANYERLNENINPYNEMLASPWAMGAWDPGTLAGLARLGREVNRQAALIGYLNAFSLYAVASAAAIPLILMTRGRRRPQPAE